MPIDVNADNFSQQVIEESHKRPVLVDFWAEWCGPCRMLGPVLDALEAEYNGKFLLAKVDTETEQNLAVQYQIQGIPAVKIFSEGKVVDEFTGALPETQIKPILDKHIPDEQVEKLSELIKNENYAEATELAISEKISAPSAHPLVWQLAEKEIETGAPDAEKVKSLLDLLPPVGSPFSDRKTVLLKFFSEEHSAEDYKNLAKLFDENTATEALDYYLKKVEDASGKDELEQAKQNMITTFALLGNSHSLVLDYRRRLSSLLF